MCLMKNDLQNFVLSDLKRRMTVKIQENSMNHLASTERYVVPHITLSFVFTQILHSSKSKSALCTFRQTLVHPLNDYSKILIAFHFVFFLHFSRRLSTFTREIFKPATALRVHSRCVLTDFWTCHLIGSLTLHKIVLE